MAKKLRCYVNRHRWVRRTFEERPYAVCSDCRKEDWDYYQTWQSRASGGQAGTFGARIPPGFGGG